MNATLDKKISGELARLAAMRRTVLEETLRRRVADLAVRASRAERTPNEAHAAHVLLRTARLQSVANWIQTRLEEHTDALQKRLVEIVEDNDPTAGPLRSRRKSLREAMAEGEEAVRDAFQGALAEAEGHFKDLGEIVAYKSSQALVRHHGAEVGEPDLSDLGHTPVMGATLAEHFQKLASDAAFRYKAALRTSFAAEETLGQALARITGAGQPVRAAEPSGDAPARFDPFKVRLLDASEEGINKVIQVAVQAFANAADAAVSDEADTEKEMGWQWVAVMDANVCPRCEFYDGNKWDSEYEPVEGAPEFPEDPPLHFNCRCALVPTDLGAEGAPEKSFEEYLAGFSRKEQEEAFGKAALRAYHRGDITANQLIGQKGNLMSLQAFKEAE